MSLTAHCICPAGAAALPPGLIEIAADGVAALVSAGPPEAERHFAVVETAANLAPTLPLPAGTAFAAPGPLLAWLGARRHSLIAGLRGVAGRAEWLLTLEEDSDAHTAWLRGQDPGLADRPDRIARARAARIALIEHRLAHGLAGLAPLLAAHPPASAALAWTLLAAPGGLAPLRAYLDLEASRLSGSGLGLALCGPSPAFGFARRVLLDA